MMAASTYRVTLHNLAPDASAAGVNYPDEQLTSVTPEQLIELLSALSKVAAGLTIYEPAAPEIRIKTERDVFVVRTRYQNLCFVGWEAKLRGEIHTIPYITTVIAGGTALVTHLTSGKPERTTTASSLPSYVKSAPADISRRIKIAVMVVLILGANAFTLWILFKPVPTLTPSYTLMTETNSHTLLIRSAGDYRTGIQPGDRFLSVNATGILRFAKYGDLQAITEPRDRSARGAMVGSKPVLITNDAHPALVEIKDFDTLICSGTIYHRIAK